MNPWLQHVTKYRETHPDTPYKECLQNCRKTYKSPVVRQSGGLIDSSNLYPGEKHGVLGKTRKLQTVNSMLLLTAYKKTKAIIP